jgi:hypothetical protein
MIEINGPPKAFFEYSPKPVRVVYRTLALTCKRPEPLVIAMSASLAQIKDALPDDGIIFWRRRPVLEDDVELGMFRVSCRLETIPKIPEKTWAGLEVPVKTEGDFCQIMGGGGG